MSGAGKRFISLAGDTHNSWVSELQNHSGEKVGVELGTPSVTSPGITDVLNLNEREFVESIIEINKELQWMDPVNRGFLSLNVKKDSILATFNFIKELDKINPKIKSSESFAICQKELTLKKLKS